MRRNILRKVWKWVQIIAVIYILVGIIFYYFQEKFIFRGVAESPDHRYSLTMNASEINIPMNETDTINMLDFKHTGSVCRGIVIYFHGNRKNVSWYAKYADEFNQNGYDLLMMDYPGYGKSRGKISEEKIYNWALQVYKLALARYPADSILIFGKSLGTGVAAQLASVRDCKRLVLETPYYSMPRLTNHFLPLFPVKWLLRYEFPTYRYIQHVSAPISIFHGTSDGIIPYRHSLLLKKIAKPGDELFTIKGGKHNRIFDNQFAKHKLDSLLLAP